MIRTRALAATGIIVASAFLLRVAAVPAQNSTPPAAIGHTDAFDQQSVWRTWKVYCDSCHFGPKARAGLNLEALDLANLDRNGAVWEKLLRKLRTREMPPPGAPRPDAATYEKLVSSIETERDRLAEVRPNPGRPTLHRLNRAEYANAIHDLLALDVEVADLLAERRRGLWLRQYWRCAHRVAGPAGTLSAGGREDQSPSGRRYDDASGLSDLRDSSRPSAGRSHERDHAGRLARRHRDRASLPG